MIFSAHLVRLITRECRGIRQVFPLLVLSVLCALALGSAFTPAASSGMASSLSPISPISPILSAATESQAREKVLPPQTAELQIVVSATPTATAIIIERVPEQPVSEEPPLLPPSSPREESNSPPTLWVIAGLVIVGAIVAGLIVFKR